MSRSRKGIFAIATGAAGGQVIGLVVTPVIAYIYGPDVYGDFALIQAVASVLVPLATLRLQFALLRPSDNRSVKTILTIGLLLSGLIAFICSLLIYGVSKAVNLDSVISTPDGAFWVFAMAWTTAIFSFMSQAALRLHEYKAVGVRHVTQQSTSGISQIGFGLIASASHVGLSAGRVLGLAASCVPLIRSARTYWETKGWAKLKKLTAEYWQYPVLFAPSALLNVLGTQMPLLLVETVYASDVTGQLAMAQRIALIPSALIGTAVSQVFASELSAKIRAGESGIRGQFLSFAGKLSLVAVMVGAALFFLGPWAVTFILGDEWSFAGDVTRVIALTVALGIVVSPLSTVFLVSNAAIMSIIADSTRVILLLSAYMSSIYLELSAIEMVTLLYGALALTYVVTFFMLYAVIKTNDTEN